MQNPLNKVESYIENGIDALANYLKTTKLFKELNEKAANELNQKTTNELDQEITNKLNISEDDITSFAIKIILLKRKYMAEQYQTLSYMDNNEIKTAMLEKLEKESKKLYFEKTPVIFVNSEESKNLLKQRLEWIKLLFQTNSTTDFIEKDFILKYDWLKIENNKLFISDVNSLLFRLTIQTNTATSKPMKIIYLRILSEEDEFIEFLKLFWKEEYINEAKKQLDAELATIEKTNTSKPKPFMLMNRPDYEALDLKAWIFKNENDPHSGKDYYVSSINLRNETITIRFSEHEVKEYSYSMKNPQAAILQNTMLFDKNGNPIYTNDIIKIDDDQISDDTDNEQYFLVKRVGGKFFALSKFDVSWSNFLDKSRDNCEIIGNIFKNSKLIDY